MDIYVQTLTGTLFELRVSPFETILSIKGKLQRLEGIPISQQHLIWKSIDLQDDYCLHDYSIKNGTTLTLVLAMRDGPINMRRVSTVEESNIQEIEDYMDANKDEIFEKLCDDKQVTLLVFRDGDQLNFYRVYDQNSESYTPNSDTNCSSSVTNNYPESLEKLDIEAQAQNSQTRDKMEELKKKMEATKFSKKKKGRPPSLGRPSSKLSQHRSGLTRKPSKIRSSSKGQRVPNSISPFIQHQERPPPESIIKDKIYLPNPPPILPPVRRTMSASKKNRHMSSSSHESTTTSFDPLVDHASYSAHINHHRKLPSLKQDTSNHVTRLIQQHEQNESSSREDIRVSSRSRRRVLKPLQNSDHHSDKLDSSTFQEHNIGPPATAERLSKRSSDLDSYSRLLNWTQQAQDIGTSSSIHNFEGIRASRVTPELKLSSRLRSVHLNSKENTHHLPPVYHQHQQQHPIPPGKKKTRCSTCTKKLGIATTYQCRCGNKFCAQHRYPETHGCSYDFKTEGRKFLEKNNPVVTAPKLPKI